MAGARDTVAVVVGAAVVVAAAQQQPVVEVGRAADQDIRSKDLPMCDRAPWAFQTLDSPTLPTYGGHMNSSLTPKRIAVVLVSTTALTAGAVGGAFAMVGDDDAQERPIPAADLDRAERAALEETGGGTVTETEVGDEESKYEVEVTLDDGTQVDVQLDPDFRVVGTESDSNEDESDD